MKPSRLLVAVSLLSILLFTFHLADDVVRGFEPGRAGNLTALPIFAVWLYGTLVLAERWTGHLVMLLGSLLALAAPVLHMRGTGVGAGSSIAGSDGAFFFVWTLLALGTCGLVGVVLAVRGLWVLRRGRAGQGSR